MKYVYNRITLDVDDMTSQASISLKRGDSARGLIVTLVKDGKIFEIEDGCHAVFSAKAGQDGGKRISDGCIIQGNKIIYEYSEKFINLNGKIDCDITISDGEKVIASPSFYAFFFNSIMEEYAKDVVESDDYQTLVALINEATDAISEVRKTNTSVGEAEKVRVSAEEGRVGEEKKRVIAEETRQEAFENASLPPQEYKNNLTEAGYYYVYISHYNSGYYDWASFGMIYWNGKNSVCSYSALMNHFTNTSISYYCLRINSDGSYTLIRDYKDEENTPSDVTTNINNKVYYHKVFG